MTAAITLLLLPPAQTAAASACLGLPRAWGGGMSHSFGMRARGADHGCLCHGDLGYRFMIQSPAFIASLAHAHATTLCCALHVLQAAVNNLCCFLHCILRV